MAGVIYVAQAWHRRRMEHNRLNVTMSLKLAGVENDLSLGNCLTEGHRI